MAAVKTREILEVRQAFIVNNPLSAAVDKTGSAEEELSLPKSTWHK